MIESAKCRLCLLFLFAVFLFFAAAPLQASARSLLFETETEQGFLCLRSYSRSFTEGDAFMLQLQSPPFRSASARFNGRVYEFVRVSEETGSFLFFPLELGMDEGRHELLLTIVFPDKSVIEKRLDVTVARGDFPSVSLVVDPKFTAPAPEEMKRIERERKRVAEIYEKPHRIWLGSGDFIMPLEGGGGVSGPFGVKRIFNNEVYSRHRGVDLRSPPGSPVRSANSGIVALTDSLFFAGRTVIIDHGAELFTLYCHLAELTVTEGEWVERGDVIGKVGATGRVTGPHLHWGVKIAAVEVDPLSILGLPFE